MDTIDVELEVGTYPQEGNPPVKFQTIHLILNGERVKATFDPYVLPYAGLFKFTTMEITTCGCGVAGCAGVFEGSKIERNDHKVTVTRIDDNLPSESYQFTTTDWDAATVKVIELMRQVAKLREAEGYDRHGDDAAYDGILHFEDEAQFESDLQRGIEYIRERPHPEEILL